MTPFSVTSLERGLDGVLVSAARVLDATGPTGCRRSRPPGGSTTEQARVEALIDALVARVVRPSDEDAADARPAAPAQPARPMEKRRAAPRRSSPRRWSTSGPDERAPGPLMISAENARARRRPQGRPPFVVANSMREVQPEINLLVSPIKENAVRVRARPARRSGTCRTEEDSMTAADDRRSRRPDAALDPLGDAEKEAEQGTKHNFAKVGSGRPSSLLYTYGPGAIMDLPQFTVMPAGLDDWDRIWAAATASRTIHAPRLRDVGAHACSPPVRSCGPSRGSRRRTRTPPRATTSACLPGCSRSGCAAPAATCSPALAQFDYRNTHPFRTDQACFEHVECTGRQGAQGAGKAQRDPAVPARYLLACIDGHLDEFPYDLWVHHGQPARRPSSPR